MQISTSVTDPGDIDMGLGGNGSPMWRRILSDPCWVEI